MDAQGFKNLSAPLRHCSFHLFYLGPVTSLISSLPSLPSAILNLYVCMKYLVNGHFYSPSVAKKSSQKRTRS